MGMLAGFQYWVCFPLKWIIFLSLKLDDLTQQKT